MTTAKAKIRVIIIDNSPTVRSLLASILSAAGMCWPLAKMVKTLFNSSKSISQISSSSTGGPSALAAVLGELPADYPLPIVVVQHVSPGFTSGLAEWLSSVTKMQVDVATHSDKLKPGTITFAPDDYHIMVNKKGEAELSHSPTYKGLRPSANPMFESLSQHYGKKSMGIILTGMDDDGADGMEALHKTGALTIAQDEKSCVVYGMPREAIIRSAIDVQINPEEISQFLKHLGQTKMNTFKTENGVL